MPPRTAWVGNPSLPSDRIKPSSSQQSQPAKSQKAKGKAKETLPASTEVVALQSLINNLQRTTGTEKDPQGGCFCQARSHGLSLYTPICHRCGLILCNLNTPCHVCPHCSNTLLTEPARKALIDKLQLQVTETIAKEAAAAERALLEAQQAAGAFPTLSASSGNLNATGGGASTPLGGQRTHQPPAVSQSHKVLSLHGKNSKVTMVSYTPKPSRSPTPSRPDSRAEKDESTVVRVPPPPKEVEHVKNARQDPGRPWADLRGNGPVYVPPPRVDADINVGGSGGRRRKGKGKQGETQPSDPTLSH